MKKIYQLDSLRGLACLLILFDHSLSQDYIAKKGFGFLGAFIGVDIFFVLSGFLISLTLRNELREQGCINIKNFFVRRLLRLTPALFVAFILFALPIYIYEGIERLWLEFFYLFSYTTVIPKMFEVLKFFPQPYYFPHAWSLSVEELFYLAFPFIFVASTTSIKSNYKFIIKLIIFYIFSFLTLPFAFDFLKGGAYHNVIMHFGQIGIGVVCGLSYFNITTITHSRNKQINGNLFMEASNKVRNFLFILTKNTSLLFAFIYIFFVIVIGSPSSIWLYYGGFPLLTLSIAIVLLTISTDPYRLSLFNSKILQEIGKISYGIYLFHLPIYRLCDKFMQGNYKLIYQKNILYFITVDIAYILFVISIAFISYYFVEIKFIKYKVFFSS